MATKLEDKIDPNELYDRHFYTWARHQADVLRSFQTTRPNVPLDVVHLIEDLGEARVRATRSQLRRLIEHLLKLEYSPANRPRQLWLKSVDNGRTEIGNVLTATVRKSVAPMLGELHADARFSAKRDPISDDESDTAAAPPATCPCILDQLVDKAWYPTNRHGDVANEL